MEGGGVVYKLKIRTPLDEFIGAEQMALLVCKFQFINLCCPRKDFEPIWEQSSSGGFLEWSIGCGGSHHFELSLK
jgi:hypothetical protein